jgi:uncharacterized membrane protein
VKDWLTAGAIAGIVIASAVLLCAGAGFGFYKWKNHGGSGNSSV